MWVSHFHHPLPRLKSEIWGGGTILRRNLVSLEVCGRLERLGGCCKIALALIDQRSPKRIITCQQQLLERIHPRRKLATIQNRIAA
jgi:hypothetical protein